MKDIFMKDDFLLNTELSRQLYYKCASDLPIIDYHNHLSLAEIGEVKRYDNIYDLWIGPDPYKHRAMRMCGIPEALITGEMPKTEKFKAWCTIFPKLIGNPLYQWSLMELKMVFGIEEKPNQKNWEKIWDQTNRYLRDNIVSVDTLLDLFHVEYICPCASLTDDISMFYTSERLAPSLRGDNIVCPDSEFLRQLSEQTKLEINDLESMKRAISIRLSEFSEAGCRFVDHALDHGFIYYKDDGQNELRLKNILEGRKIGDEDRRRLTSYMLLFLGEEYAKRKFVMQLHIGAQRFTSSKLRKLAGAAGGFACIGNNVDIVSLTTYLDELEQTQGGLPQIMLFTLNPADNGIISVLSGSYSKDYSAGLITQGPAWWWCDHKHGICDVLDHVASFGLLSNFVGMTTDSRSFLSLVRHDYFRRILCDWIGIRVSQQELPDSYGELRELVYDLCYGNAKKIWRNTNGTQSEL